jgi:ComF family protein
MLAITERLRTIWSAVADTAFPQACLGCGGVLYGRGAEWCNACFKAMLEATATLYCPMCGRDAGPYEIVDGRCGRCSPERFAHDGLVRVAAYTGLVRSLIRQYKFTGQERLDQTLGQYLAARIERAPWRQELDAVVPVPSHWTVRHRRGFFSTGALAREAAKVLGLQSLNLLVRPRRGRSQIGLSATDRRANVRGMFVLRRRVQVEGRTLCVVDDVMVTGATLYENVRVLKKAGVKAVYVAILAKADSTDAAMVDV